MPPGGRHNLSLTASEAQVETLLSRQEPQEAPPNRSIADDRPEVAPLRRSPENLHENTETGVDNTQARIQSSESFQVSSMQAPVDPLVVESGLGGSNTFTGGMMSLGIDEPLPIQEVIDEL